MQPRRKTIAIAAHDDGGGGFAVLWRIARALVHVADEEDTALDLYFLNSSMGDAGSPRVAELVRGATRAHRAVFVPTDNLIRLPKDARTAAVDGARIPEMLRSIRPRWHEWPRGPECIRREHSILAQRIPARRTRVDLGISNGVPQLHRIARDRGFPSVEAGDWFFSVGLRECMRESDVPSDVIASVEPDLRTIEADELKAREAWLLPFLAPLDAYRNHLANSAVGIRVMDGILWSGEPVPAEGIAQWHAARALRREIDGHLSAVRGLPDDDVRQVRVVFIVGGATGVWTGIVQKLRANETERLGAAVVDVDRDRGSLVPLERGGEAFVSEALQPLTAEERHLALCRASDLGVTRTAGGVLGFAATRRPAVLVDEPGHWLGRLQREQCTEAGICVPLSVHELLDDPRATIQKQADTLGAQRVLEETVTASERLRVGAERDCALYLWRTYLARN